MYKISIRDPFFLPHCGCEVDIQLEKGDFITFVGENGVGKSTLARRIYRDLQGETSFIQQQPIDVFYDRTLKKIKNIFLSSRKNMLSCERFEELWKSFNLSRKEDRLQSTLSGGEGQALKLCMGLAIEKNIYILDEPSQFLDSTSKEMLNEFITGLIKENKTLIMIEHDLSWIKSSMKVSDLSVQGNILKERSSWIT